MDGFGCCISNPSLPQRCFSSWWHVKVLGTSAAQELLMSYFRSLILKILVESRQMGSIEEPRCMRIPNEDQRERVFCCFRQLKGVRCGETQAAIPHTPVFGASQAPCSGTDLCVEVTEVTSGSLAACLAIAFLLRFRGGLQPCAPQRGFSSSGKLKQYFTTRGAPGNLLKSAIVRCGPPWKPCVLFPCPSLLS